ncbi:helix-turn-helix domain-containing protein [Shewanella glacialipiscicola]|uniref:helix-turn-helix transcriptional regulator n=1 Tax=Shewanella glacialipiscicola TaxID=614069 RepID=UPI0021D952C5|nr:helix-turn-helix transcriptional regulator [Shewanella glacialipiscicola]MCU7996582.1 helix-turn-helix domain-containing protein [Shewanella glacialipiscicola]MCU8027895.1 helix-turn-helix domain-containing protein [Shewanella glacialipiscicola]
MEMKINSEIVKDLRNQKSWSQEHLASVSGLSLRTIQRIENSGACSLESKKALASVFNIESTTLEVQAQGIIKSTYSNTVFGYAGASIGLISAYAAITYSLANHQISYALAGSYYGAIGAFCGICFGIIGYISKQKKA